MVNPMNSSNLSHIRTTIKIFLAMRKAAKTGIAQYVFNRKGEPFLRVCYARNTVGAFSFWDKSQRNVTESVLKVLRSHV